MNEPTVTITQAEYDALQKVAACWDENCHVWHATAQRLTDCGRLSAADRFEAACNAMDDAVAEAVKKEKKA